MYNSSMASSILSIVYDIDLDTMHDDKYFDMFEYIAEVGDNISVPGRFPVEGLPWLRYLPSWFPGGGFKTYAAGASDNIARTIQHFFDIAKKSIVSIRIRNSFQHTTDPRYRVKGMPKSRLSLTS